LNKMAQKVLLLGALLCGYCSSSLLNINQQTLAEKLKNVQRARANNILTFDDELLLPAFELPEATLTPIGSAVPSGRAVLKSGTPTGYVKRSMDFSGMCPQVDPAIVLFFAMGVCAWNNLFTSNSTYQWNVLSFRWDIIGIVTSTTYTDGNCAVVMGSLETSFPTSSCIVGGGASIQYSYSTTSPDATTAPGGFFIKEYMHVADYGTGNWYMLIWYSSSFCFGGTKFQCGSANGYGSTYSYAEIDKYTDAACMSPPQLETCLVVGEQPPNSPNRDVFMRSTNDDNTVFYFNFGCTGPLQAAPPCAATYFTAAAPAAPGNGGAMVMSTFPRNPDGSTVACHTTKTVTPMFNSAQTDVCDRVDSGTWTKLTYLGQVPGTTVGNVLFIRELFAFAGCTGPVIASGSRSMVMNTCHHGKKITYVPTTPSCAGVSQTTYTSSGTCEKDNRIASSMCHPINECLSGYKNSTYFLSCSATGTSFSYFDNQGCSGSPTDVGHFPNRICDVPKVGYKAVTTKCNSPPPKKNLRAD